MERKYGNQFGLKTPRTPIWDEALNCYRVELTQGVFTLVDKDDYHLVAVRCWGVNRGYAICNKSMGGTLRLHRVIMGNPDGMCVDHINGNTLDNRRSNLRVCTKAQNNHNQRKHVRKITECSSKFRGVTFNKRLKKYCAVIGKDRKHIGVYATETEAALAWNAKAKELFGEFARLNEVPA